MILNKLKQIRKAENFHPGFIGFFINANFLIRKNLRKAILTNANLLTGSLLDFGCGTKPYKDFFTGVSEYIGVDYKIEGREEAQKEVDVFYDGKTIPFEDEKFDSILCTEVLEHVFNLDELLLEFNRVLKIGGKAITTTPFMWEEHEMPYDYARYTTPALKFLYEKNGFEIVNNYKIGNHIHVIATFCSRYLVNKLPFRTLFRYIILSFTIFYFNLLGSIFGYILPEDQTVYFNNIFIIRKIKNV